jgi:hypothetical protein
MEELTAVLKLIPALTGLVTVQGAGHELVSTRAVGNVTTTVVKAFWSFVTQ